MFSIWQRELEQLTIVAEKYSCRAMQKNIVRKKYMYFMRNNNTFFALFKILCKNTFFMANFRNFIEEKKTLLITVCVYKLSFYLHISHFLRSYVYSEGSSYKN